MDAAAAPLPPPAEGQAAAFRRLQAGLAPMFARVFSDPAAPRTVVVVPGLSMDPELLARIDGVRHYEERQLSMLMLLRLPATRVVFVSSTPIAPAVIDYQLQLLAGVPHAHASRRLTLISAHDASPQSLTLKLLSRPRLLARLREAIGAPSLAHLSCFNATEAERSLALALGIPLYACDPALADLGSKSGSRECFRAAGVPCPPGRERLASEADLVEALAALKTAHPELQRAAVKLNEGASGEGNAVLSLAQAPADPAALADWLQQGLRERLRFEAPDETWPHFLAKLQAIGGIVEAWLDNPPGLALRSPSVQCRITPTGGIELISTHDQLLGGATGQKFLGCRFPADAAYREVIQRHGLAVARVLRERGALGRFGVDFIARAQPGGGWDVQAIEINLRKGGTTHTFQTLQSLTEGALDAESGEFLLPEGGGARVYRATDNLQSAAYRRLTPDDLIEVAVSRGLHFDGRRQEGVVFNLIGALAEFGKLGLVSIAASQARADALYEQAVRVLDEASA